MVIWDARTAERLFERSHESSILAIAYGGTTGGLLSLASVDSHGIAKVWDAQTFALRREIKSYGVLTASDRALGSAPGALNGTAFSQDGRFLVTAGTDLSIWEAATGARLRVLSGHGGLFATSIRGDSRVIAVGGAGGFVGIFDCEVCLPMDELVKLATARAPRELTEQERKDILVAAP